MTEPKKRPKPSKSDRDLSADHKAALAEGRKAAAAIRRYLEALQAEAALKHRGPGRRHTPESLRKKLDKIESELVAGPASPLRELALRQEKLDVMAQLDELESAVAADPNDHVEDFIAVAKLYSDRKGVERKAWREMGVPAPVLDKAGVK